MRCRRWRDPPCSPIDRCSASTRFALSPPSPASISAAGSPPRTQHVAVRVTCDIIHKKIPLRESCRLSKQGLTADSNIFNCMSRKRKVSSHLCSSSAPQWAEPWWGAALWWRASTTASPSRHGSYWCSSGCSGLPDPESKHTRKRAVTKQERNTNLCF